MRLKPPSIARVMPRKHAPVSLKGLIGASLAILAGSFVALVFLLFILLACRPDSGGKLEHLMAKEDRVFSQRCYAGELHEWDMVGIWVLDADCVPNLSNTAGFQKYTNRADHVIVLNADGSAIARMAHEYSYVVARSRTPQEESDGYEQWVSELYKFDVSSPGGYYLWNPGSIPPISGPYTEIPDTAAGQVLKTKITRWRLVWRAWDEVRQTGWYVEFARPSASGATGGMLVALIDDRICLYTTSRNDWPLDERTQTFRFSKVTEADLQRITRETVNEGEVGDRVD